MDFRNIKESANTKKELYINNRKIKIVEYFELFDLCGILYEDTNEQEMVDKMEILDVKKDNKFIAIDLFNRG